jgi:adenine-specific DNA-methyltransferase
MKHIQVTPRQSLNKAYLKEKPTRANIELFKKNLIGFLDGINEKESEEHFKNLVTKFLYDTYYNGKNQINTKGRIDLAIYEDKKPVVIIEAKRPDSPDMIAVDNLNKKATHELLLYYLQERVDHGNIDIKYLVITNTYEWFIFDASVFDNLFYRNSALMKDFIDWKSGRKARTDRDLFYNDIAKPFLKSLKDEIKFTWFDLRKVAEFAKNDNPKDDVKLTDIFKILSPAHLLKQPFSNDSNSLDTKFYSELLHIIGLEEKKDGGKKLIQRKEKPDAGSLLENTINNLIAEDRLRMLPKSASDYGVKNEDRLFNVALELCITWINRVLFLKLLEGQMLTYHGGDKSFRFLDSQTIPNYDELNKLFFQVLARKESERTATIREKFARVPYLNSSLFDTSSLEDDALRINSLDDSLKLKISGSTVLKTENGKKREGELPALQYLFEFLDAYDFSSEGKEEIQEENKTLINASVLGLIFEKINGYKDGSFFTPGFITMYMCRETIRRAVVQKFNEAKKWKLETFDQLYNKVTDVQEANEIINSLKICDPAVGSGHFLVSALNEIIAIKSELGILADRHGKVLRDYDVHVVNDELIIETGHNEFFDYKLGNKESQRVQEALFHEKQTLIENCLFGVDINPNSVKICRLRLWIELLKSAYYTTESKYEELETLPNIDINIKQGNSLISRFALDADLSKALKSIKYSIDDYRVFVDNYKNATDKEEKRGFEKLINQIKADFRTEISKYSDPDKRKLQALNEQMFQKYQSGQLYDLKLNEKQKKDRAKLENDINKLSEKIRDRISDAIFKDAFEWRFEFPEVLDNEGKFIGFDAIIGNPPYIRQEEIKEQKSHFQNNYETYSGTADLYVFFAEKAFSLLTFNGSFSFIMPNKWMQTEYGKPLRSFLLGYRLHSIIDFGDQQLFEEATTYPCILIASKSTPGEKAVSMSVTSLKFENGFDAYLKQIVNEIMITELSDQTWIISSDEDQALLNKLKSKGPNLFEYLKGEAHFGIKTGLSEAFVISDENKEELIKLDVNSKDLLVPFLLGREIKSYVTPKAKNWLILIPKGFTNSNNKTKKDPWAWFKNKYPAIANHLEAFKLKASSRSDKGDYWWELRACDYYDEFGMPKIMYQVFQVKPCFIFDEDKLFCNNSMWIIPKSDKVLLAILNSKVGWWLISKYCTAIQNGYQLIWKYFGQIPMPKKTDKQSKLIIDLVDKLLKAKGNNANSVIGELEVKIDQLVYQLYDLTEEEIKLIEHKKTKSFK